MTDLTFDDIVSSSDLKTEKIWVKEWNGDVYIRQMTGKENDDWEKSRFDKDGKFNLTNARARLVAVCLVDKDGKQIFNDITKIEKLSGKSAVVLNRLVDKITELNKVTQEDVEELAKN